MERPVPRVPAPDVATPVSTMALSISKILDNMEIGHNLMHGQYDWTRDEALSSRRFDWDTACLADQWRHTHKLPTHTFTNIVGKDRDVGYGVLRMSEDQRWYPSTSPTRSSPYSSPPASTTG